MSAVNNRNIVVRAMCTPAGTRYVARVLSARSRTGQVLRSAYTFTQIPTMTRDEAIMDVEQNLQYGVYPS